MSRAPIVADLVRGQARTLKMPGLARGLEALARQAREERWTHEEYLQELLAVEVVSRHDSALRQSTHDMRSLEVETLDAFDFKATEGVDAAQVTALARGERVGSAGNVAVAGPIGTGKTHLMWNST